MSSAIDSIFKHQALLPIIQADTVEEGLQVTQAMLHADMKVVEVVLRNDTALTLAQEIKQSFPDVILGIGTVYNTKILDSALKAGADFIVTPATTSSLTQALLECDTPFLPGVSNLKDIAELLDLGVNRMKLFPAEIVGGANFLKAVSSLFQDLSFCPTGGVNADNQRSYLSLPNVFAVGGTWMVPKDIVQKRDWEAITQACHAAMAASK